MVQWISETYIYFFSAIPQIIASAFMLRLYQKTRYSGALNLTLSLLSSSTIFVLDGLAELFLNPYLLIWSVCLFAPQCFFTAIASDMVQKETISVWKMILVSGVSGAFFLSATLPDAVHYAVNAFGEDVVEWGGWFDIFGSLLMLMTIIFFAVLVINVNRQTKLAPNLKLPARWCLCSVGLFIVSVTLVTIPIAGYQFFAAAGFLIISYIFYLNPKLLFLLPFKPLRLTVLHNESGLPLFTHTWKLGFAMADETLFAGMLQGVSLIVKESMNRGALRELALAQGVLLLHASEASPVTCALVATRSSKTLRDALAGFSERFCEEFVAPLKTPHFVDAFAPAAKLVDICFPFVPDYESKGA